jgi:hypothetical protein
MDVSSSISVRMEIANHVSHQRPFENTDNRSFRRQSHPNSIRKAAVTEKRIRVLESGKINGAHGWVRKSSAEI